MGKAVWTIITKNGRQDVFKEIKPDKDVGICVQAITGEKIRFSAFLKLLKAAHESGASVSVLRGQE